MASAHHEQLLALVKNQAPDHHAELAAYIEDPLLFAATALALIAAGVVAAPAGLERALSADLATAQN